MKNYSIIVLIALMLFSCTPKPNAVITLWIGGYTGDDSQGIHTAMFDTGTGELKDLKLAHKVENPSFLDLTDNNLWSVSASGGGSAVSFAKQERSLTLLNELSSDGKGACYIDYHKGMVSVANYGSGDGVVYRVDEQGALGEKLFNFKHSGQGPNESRQTSAHAHCAIFSPDGKYLYVVDLGIDQVMGYATSGDSIGQAFVALQLLPGDGPRHLTFHPSKPQAFLINELSGTLVSGMIREDGRISQVDRKSSMPEGYDGHIQSADIHVSPDGQYLYATNRGHNSIVSVRISDKGELNVLDHTSVEGDWPRNFTLTPDGAFVLVANRRTNNITIFSRDLKTGLLTFTGNELKISEPSCLIFE
ncbi:MAG: lactonase family protein [Cyclobacteriaceae bacterium]